MIKYAFQKYILWYSDTDIAKKKYKRKIINPLKENPTFEYYNQGWYYFTKINNPKVLFIKKDCNYKSVFETIKSQNCYL